MQINNYSQNVNFGAKLLSKAYVGGSTKQPPIALYSLDITDIAVIEKFNRNFNLERLYPEVKNYDDFRAWEHIILGGISHIGERNVVLAVEGRKPCGVMTYYEKDKRINLTHLAKWRPSTDSKSKFIGKILMHHLFDIANKNKVLNISLYPSYCKPRGKNCKSFYLDLGFKNSASGSMNLFGANYAQKAAQLENHFNYKNFGNQKEINAAKYFCFSFNDPMFQRIKKLFQ